jgi:hypothetical protein
MPSDIDLVEKAVETVIESLLEDDTLDDAAAELDAAWDRLRLALEVAANVG